MNTIYITGNEYGGWASRIFVNNDPPPHMYI
jgi:hypothetical protein